MKILCPVKFTPDVNSDSFDIGKPVLHREEYRQILNPDDACAVGFALKIKKQQPDTVIEVITMAPMSIKKQAEDIARRGVDQVAILTDPWFTGSDTLATSRTLCAYIRRQEFDVILTGTRSLDGDTGHVPAELAAFLGVECLCGITSLEEESFLTGKPVVQTETELDTCTYEISFPAVLGISSRSGIRLPFVRFADLDLDVSRRLRIVSAEELGLMKDRTGMEGSATKVIRTFRPDFREKQERVLVREDEEGVETVYRFLKEKGYLG